MGTVQTITFPLSAQLVSPEPKKTYTVQEAVEHVIALFKERYQDMHEGTYPVTLAHENHAGFHPFTEPDNQVIEWCIRHRKSPDQMLTSQICIHFWHPVACVIFYPDGRIIEYLDPQDPHWRLPKS